MNVTTSKKDTLMMKLLHYFITEQNYNPVVLHGAENEIWLENMDNDYEIVRLVSNYIHNNEQLDFDIFKTKKITKNIQRKTLNLNMNVLSIYTDLGENVKLKNNKHLDCIKLEDEKDIKKSNILLKHFPSIEKKLKFEEKGIDLFMKITDDINQKNLKEAQMIDKIFTPKKPIITYILIAINIFVFLFALLFNASEYLVEIFSNYGPYIRQGQLYRLLTSAFVHVNLFHILFNMYALYIIGSQAESFFGKTKYLVIYIVSAITGSLLSILLNMDTASIGASGAIFGLLGSLLYFGLNYRVYLGNTLIKEILPVIVLNLILGFTISGVDNFAHIGGLVGGFLITMALGITAKNKQNDRINGIILTLMYIGFLIFMNFFYI